LPVNIVSYYARISATYSVSGNNMNYNKHSLYFYANATSTTLRPSVTINNPYHVNSAGKKIATFTYNSEASIFPGGCYSISFKANKTAKTYAKQIRTRVNLVWYFIVVVQLYRQKR
jgi:hypothetical protein